MHQRISKKIFIYLLIFFTLVTITNKKLAFDLFKIKEFNIISTYDLDTKKIYDDLKDFKNTNIFSFEKENILNIIYSNKAVEEFEVYKIYPSTLNVKIKKTKILGITKKKNIDYFVGANGNLIEINNIDYNLPYIFGNVDIKSFLSLKKLIDNSNFEFDEIDSFYYFNSNRWDIVKKNGLVLKLPHELSVKKMNLIYEIIKNDKFKNFKNFDFRQGDIMVINE